MPRRIAKSARPVLFGGSMRLATALLMLWTAWGAALPAGAASVPRNPLLLACERATQPFAQALAHETFDQDRFVLLERWARGRPVGACQAAVLLPVFAFQDSMLRALAILAPQIVDRDNAAIILVLFPLDETRAAARRLLGFAPR